MTDTELTVIERRAQAAMPGPWHLAICCDEYGGVDGRSNIEVGAIDVADDVADNDADFIAHAREDTPALIAEIRRLRQGLARLRTAVDVAAVYTVETHHQEVYSPVTQEPALLWENVDYWIEKLLDPNMVPRLDRRRTSTRM